MRQLWRRLSALETETTESNLIIQYFCNGLSSMLGFNSVRLFVFRLICLLDVEICPERLLYQFSRIHWFKCQARNCFYKNHSHFPEYPRARNNFLPQSVLFHSLSFPVKTLRDCVIITCPILQSPENSGEVRGRRVQETFHTFNPTWGWERH